MQHARDIDWGASGGRDESGALIVRPVVVRLSDVKPEVVRWLWFGRLALAKLTLLIGNPGLGKSWITLFVAAVLSIRGRWPDGTVPPATMNTLLLTAEDGLGDTIRPRLDALGADVERIHHLAVLKAGDAERAVQLADVAMIEQAILETDARVLIIDPVSAYVGDTDSHKDAPVRGLLAPLAAMAERRGVAVLAVMHLKKDTKGPAVHRAGGSIAFAAAARIVLAVAEDADRGNQRVLASVKQNLCAAPPALAYALDEGRLTWNTDPVTVDIDALLNGPDGDRSDRTDAEQVIHDLLDDVSLWPMDANDARKAGAAHGVHERTLQRAAKAMGIRIARQGFGRGGRWVWHRPAIDDRSGENGPTPPVVSPMSPMQEQAYIHDNTHIDDTKNAPPRAREDGVTDEHF